MDVLKFNKGKYMAEEIFGIAKILPRTDKGKYMAEETGKKALDDFLKKQEEWQFKIVNYMGEDYEVIKTAKYMYIAYNKKWNSSILYCSHERPAWDLINNTWRKNKGDQPLEVRIFQGVIPYLASKASLVEI